MIVYMSDTAAPSMLAAPSLHRSPGQIPVRWSVPEAVSVRVFCLGPAEEGAYRRTGALPPVPALSETTAIGERELPRPPDGSYLLLLEATTRDARTFTDAVRVTCVDARAYWGLIVLLCAAGIAVASAFIWLVVLPDQAEQTQAGKLFSAAPSAITAIGAISAFPVIRSLLGGGSIRLTTPTMSWIGGAAVLAIVASCALAVLSDTIVVSNETNETVSFLSGSTVLFSLKPGVSTLRPMRWTAEKVTLVQRVESITSLNLYPPLAMVSRPDEDEQTKKDRGRRDGDSGSGHHERTNHDEAEAPSNYTTMHVRCVNRLVVVHPDDATIAFRIGASYYDGVQLEKDQQGFRHTLFDAPTSHCFGDDTPSATQLMYEEGGGPPELFLNLSDVWLKTKKLPSGKGRIITLSKFEFRVGDATGAYRVTGQMASLGRDVVEAPKSASGYPEPAPASVSVVGKCASGNCLVVLSDTEESRPFTWTFPPRTNGDGHTQPSTWWGSMEATGAEMKACSSGGAAQEKCPLNRYVMRSQQNAHLEVPASHVTQDGELNAASCQFSLFPQDRPAGALRFWRFTCSSAITSGVSLPKDLSQDLYELHLVNRDVAARKIRNFYYLPTQQSEQVPDLGTTLAFTVAKTQGAPTIQITDDSWNHALDQEELRSKDPGGGVPDGGVQPKARPASVAPKHP